MHVMNIVALDPRALWLRAADACHTEKLTPPTAGTGGTALRSQ
jgi:hypothetical protein